jgi:hypothetical protein
MVKRVRSNSSARQAVGPLVYVPIVYTFIRPASSSGRPLTTEQYEAINRSFGWLNKFHRGSNLNYYIAYINTVDNDADNSRNWDAADGYNYTFPLRLPKDAVNIVIVPKMDNYSGYSYYPSSSSGQSTNVVYINSVWLGYQDNLLPHEVGHYFNLLHTFETSGGNRELVNGSNCSVAGDLICDTPADPYDATKPGTLNSGCTYTGTVTDANGELYRPDMTNIMSYWHSSGTGCPTDHLSQGQYNRLYDGYRFRLENPGNGEQKYGLNAPEATIAAPQLSMTRLRNGVSLSMSLETGSTGLIIERSSALEGPWSVLAGSYQTTYTDSPDLTKTWFYRVRNSNSTRYSNIVTLTPLKDQTITFNKIPGQTYGAGLVSLSASSSADLPILFQVTSGPGQIVNGNQLQVKGAGTIYVQASQNGNEEYASSIVYQTCLVAKADQTISFSTIPAKTFGDASFPVSATASTGLPVQFQVSSGPATISGSKLTIEGAGAIVVRAYQPGNSNYNLAQASYTVNVAKANQSLMFDALTDKTYGDLPFSLSAKATSGLGVTYRVNGSVAIADNRASITGAGSVTVIAQQPGNQNYNPSAEIARTFTISKASQRLSITPVSPKTYGDAAFKLSVKTSSGLSPVIEVTSGPARVEEDLIVLTGAGRVSLRISQPGNENYLAAKDTTQAFAVAKANQTISFTSLPKATFGDPDITLNAHTSSGLDIIYQLVSGPGSIDTNRLVIKGAGQLIIRATQAGNANYNPATDVTQTLIVAKRKQVIQLDTLLDRNYSPAPFDIPLVSNSTLPIRINVTGPAELVNGTRLRMLRAGVVTLTTVQPGDTNNLASETLTRSFTVRKATQVISSLPDAIELAATTYPLNLTTTSGLPIAYTLLSGPAKLQTNTLTFSDYGQITLQISQAGDERYQEVVPKTYTICVNPAKPQISASPTSPLLLVSSSPFRNQWFYKGDTLRGATNSTLAVSLPGEYTVRVANPVAECGSSQESDMYNVIILAIGEPVASQLVVSPNPASEQLQIRLELPVHNESVTAELISLTSQSVLHPITLSRSASGYQSTISVREMVAGIYLLRVQLNGQTLTKRVLIH